MRPIRAVAAAALLAVLGLVVAACGSSSSSSTSGGTTAVVINTGGKPPEFTLREDRYVPIEAVKRALEQRRPVHDNGSRETELGAKYRFENIIGSSAQMQNVFGLIAKCAPIERNSAKKPNRPGRPP